jgi:enhancer of polycomb-like protein
VLSFISRVTGLKIGINDLGIPLIRPEISIKPKERLSAMSHQIENTLARQRDIDHQWEDCVDVSKLIYIYFS